MVGAAATYRSLKIKTLEDFQYGNRNWYQALYQLNVSTATSTDHMMTGWRG
jgi:hypothetical protein